MGATFARVKTWTQDLENLTNEELNTEIQNILDNLTPTGIDDHSVNTAQMRLQTTPGAVGTESLATSLAGELQRIRYVINRILGTTYWYETPALSISEIDTLISAGNTIPDNRIVSGLINSATSKQPMFLVPHGTNATVTVEGASTNFLYRIAGTLYTISSNVSATGLSLAPSSNNTATVNDAYLSGQGESKYAGEITSHIPTITIASAGSEITALVGKYAAFKVGTEYFIAFVKSSTELVKAQRGCFFDSADAPFVRTTVSNGATITLCRLTWVYARTDGTITVSYTNPVYAYDQPTSPGSGDYWYDMANNVWKTYNGAAFVDATAILVGICVQDTSGCKAARSFDFYGNFEDLNNIELEYVDASTVRSKTRGGRINVYGTRLEFGHDLIEFETANDLASGVSDSASAEYYLYITSSGDNLIDTERPYLRDDLMGYYHPHNAWRCIGRVDNDGSSNFASDTVVSYLNGNRPAHRTGASSTAAPGEIGLSSSSSNFSSASASYVDVTNLSVRFTATGRPIMLTLVPDGNGTNVGRMLYSTGAPSFKFLRDSTNIAEYTVTNGGSISAGFQTPIAYDRPTPGVYTYKLQGKITAGSFIVEYMKLLVREL